MKNSSLHFSNSPGNSTLGQRLQRRVIKPAGVINTQQLHCHYQATQGTAGRLVQRVALPEQVKFRYGSGILQPTAMIQRLQRQRHESADVLHGQDRPRQFHHSSHTNILQPPITQKATLMTKGLVKATDHNHLQFPVSSVQKKPKSDISTPLVKTSKGAGEGKRKVEKHRKLRIDRQGTASEVNALSSNESHSVQRQVDTDSNSHPTVTQTQLETSGTMSPPSSESSGTFRISRQARISTAHLSNSLIGGGSQSRLRRKTTDACGEPNRLCALTVGESKSSKSQDLPLAQATSQLSASIAQTKADDFLQPKTNPTVIPGIMPTTAATKSQSTVSTRSIIPVIPNDRSLSLSRQGQQANLPIQLAPERALASNPAVVSPKFSQLSDSSELSGVWLKSSNGLQVSEGLSATTSSSQKMPLPLAKNPISINRAIAKRPPEGQIARQTDAVDNSTVQLAMEGNLPTLMSVTDPASTLSIDVTKIAEQVSRILARQLAVERERRGVGRW